MRFFLYTIGVILLIPVLSFVVLVLLYATSFIWQDTRYAKGYTEEKFSMIKIGMNEKDVINILGEPLVRWRPYEHTMYKHKRHYVDLQYSESPTSTNYHLRQVILDSGTVVEIRNYYYLD